MKFIKQAASLVFYIIFSILFDKLFNLLPTNYKKNIEYVIPIIGLALFMFDLYFVLVKRKYETTLYIIIADICFLIPAGILTYFLSTNNISKGITFIHKRNNEIFISFVIFMIILLVRAYLKSAKFKISDNNMDGSC